MAGVLVLIAGLVAMPGSASGSPASVSAETSQPILRAIGLPNYNRVKWVRFSIDNTMNSVDIKVSIVMNGKRIYSDVPVAAGGSVLVNLTKTSEALAIPTSLATRIKLKYKVVYGGTPSAHWYPAAVH